MNLYYRYALRWPIKQKVSFFKAVAFALLIMTAFASRGAHAAFVCDGRTFLTQGQDNTELSLVDIADPVTFMSQGPPATIQYNAVGFNPLDNYLYAIRDTGNPGPNSQMYRIETDGSVTLVGEVDGLDSSARYLSGTIDSNGMYYIVPEGNSDRKSVV